MTKREIYDTICSLTSEIKKTGVAEKLFEAAKSKNGRKKVKKTCENFIIENSYIYMKIMRFATDVNQLIEKSEHGKDAEIFGLEKNEENGIWVFDPNVIHASSFFVLVFLGRIDDAYFFECNGVFSRHKAPVFDFSVYLDALEKESGSSELSNFLVSASFTQEELECLEEYGFVYQTVEDILHDVFVGKLKDYIAL